LWIPITEKYGARPVLAIVCTMSTLAPLSMIFITPANFWFLSVIYFITSFVASGVELGTSRALFKTAPRKNDAYYLASFSAGVGLPSAIGPILGGLIATFVRGPFFGPIKYVFLISFIFRVLCLPLIYKLHEPKARTVEDVLYRIKQLRYYSFFTGMYSFANYTSKIVLFPQKQLFFIQRRTTERLRTDVVKALQLISKARYSVAQFTSNKKYLLQRLPLLRRQLKQEAKDMSYAKGTLYRDIPVEAASAIEKLSKDVAHLGKREAGKVEKQMKKFRDKLEGAYERNIK